MNRMWMDLTNSMSWFYDIIAVFDCNLWNWSHMAHDPIGVVPLNDDRDLDSLKLMKCLSGSETVSTVDHDTFFRPSQIQQHLRSHPSFRSGNVVIAQVVVYKNHTIRNLSFLMTSSPGFSDLKLDRRFPKSAWSGWSCCWLSSCLTSLLFVLGKLKSWNDERKN